MSNDSAMTTARDAARSLLEAAMDKKAVDPVVLEMASLLGICDYFLILTSTSSTQTDALVDHLEKRAAELGLKRGLRASRSEEWTLLDFGDVIVHIFTPESREFYRLETLWKDAPRAFEELVEDARE